MQHIQHCGNGRVWRRDYHVTFDTTLSVHNIEKLRGFGNEAKVKLAQHTLREQFCAYFANQILEHHCRWEQECIMRKEGRGKERETTMHLINFTHASRVTNFSPYELCTVQRVFEIPGLVWSFCWQYSSKVTSIASYNEVKSIWLGSLAVWSSSPSHKAGLAAPQLTVGLLFEILPSPERFYGDNRSFQAWFMLLTEESEVWATTWTCTII